MKTNKKHTQGFKVPDGYFDTLNDEIFQAIDINESFPKRQGFEVPDGYFETLEHTLNDPVINNKSKGFVRSLPFIMKVGLPVAASLLLFILLNYSSNNKKTTLAEVEQSQIMAYIDDDNLELDTYDMIDLWQDDEAEILEIPEYISKDDIETYLLNFLDSQELSQTEL